MAEAVRKTARSWRVFWHSFICGIGALYMTVIFDGAAPRSSTVSSVDAAWKSVGQHIRAAMRNENA